MCRDLSGENSARGMLSQFRLCLIGQYRLTEKTRRLPQIVRGKKVEGERKWYIKAIGGGYNLSLESHEPAAPRAKQPQNTHANSLKDHLT